MKRMMIVVWLWCLGAVTANAQTSDDFYAYWGDGQAELSSYRIMESRYGELREATGVLIFVTEEINRRTLIKVESDQPPADRIYVLKLNNTLNFLTGIYPYSVMTSVFSAVEGGPSEPGQTFEARKINLSVQEWCGHVFEEAQFRGDEIHGEVNSYFEREGKGPWQLERPDAFVSEDHLPIEIRELKGQFMAAGETRKVQFLPALWQLRQWHVGRDLVEGTLTKGAPETTAVDGVDYQATPWSWSYASRQVTMWVETAYPRRILRWQDNKGGTGELLASMRLPYWRLNKPGDESYRDELRLPSGGGISTD